MSEPKSESALPEWDATAPGLRVRLADNPGRQGTTTGRTKRAGSFLMVEVDFGPNEKQFKRYELLEPVGEEKEIFDLLERGVYGGPIDLRRVLTFEKIKGELTNIFYSMEASNTDFYPHQFKPVMRFIESPVGRMLIADEVGLGKTIEAAYIWKEIQARESARRLLIVCPAMLREKWRSDLRKRFNITSEIISARDLLEKVKDVAEHRTSDSFVCITSLEGLRPPANYEDEKSTGVKARFARLLEENTTTEEFAIFDHVIIDEAHYLRNPSTGNNRLGRLLREAARHLILLTATPIQIGSDNLFQLLRLIDPDQFYDSFLFDEILSANSSIVRAQRCLWQQPADLSGAHDALKDARRSDYFKSDPVLVRIQDALKDGIVDPERRVEILRLLEGRSLLSQYMTRSRKREVLENRVLRAPQTLSVRFSEPELALYNHVTERIRDEAVGKSGVSLFALVARQRQMASSLVGALESWRDTGQLTELLWEDFGMSPEMLKDATDSGDDDSDSVSSLTAPAYDLAALERGDEKYRALRDFLVDELAKNPNEKFVVFAFFRGTLKYLQRRLSADGIRTALIMGDMGSGKDEIIRGFAKPEGASVLLSSEVGSEGIDLQFCRFVVNYDLPWNPMRVEQRIGRLDRLGQQAKRISIINLSVENTIEDRILLRLYERINVFRESIGDLEDILGEVTEQLAVDLFNPNLTDAERESRSAQAELAIRNTQKEREQLEEEAVNLVGFSDYILDHVKDSRDKGRWLSADELRSLVEDFFARNFPRTKIDPADKVAHAARIILSEEARASLGYFISEKRPSTRTALHRSNRPVLCIFDPRRADDVPADAEFIEPSHPLVQWIRAQYEAELDQLHPVSAIKVNADEVDLPPGDYVFSAQRWSFIGLKSEQALMFRATRLGSAETLSAANSEQLVSVAARVGQSLPNAVNILPGARTICESVLVCEEALGDLFGERLADFEAENTVRCNQQRTSAEKLAQRRLADLKSRVQRFRSEGNLRPVAMTEGLIRKEEEQLKTKLDRVNKRLGVDPTMIPLAAGVIRVVES
ncbi:DEAD/DEAH box helicase family protein [Ochrobactrum anthropi]|uniref:SNF2-related protein n=1 Tax=Brucella anthropi TaxID=529 RepID=UPI00194F350A|nr:SNF2-related protein [Brucella anthropi]MBM6395279.1 DEAD/DEAH box helicase family protein [Brucella anthropi]